MDDSPPQRSPVAVPGPTGRRPWSTMLLREWAAARYPGIPLREQLRLGPTTSELNGRTVSPAMQRAMSVFNWFSDGILVLDDQVLVIEAKLRATPAAVSQVEFYLQQMIRTPELQQFMNRPFVPLVLWAIDDPAVSAYARSRGVRVEVYTPAWIEDWMSQVLYRTRRTNPPKPPGETT
jgi:hypothetical protein